MGVAWLHRAVYRVRQFGGALARHTAGRWRKPSGLRCGRGYPTAAWPLFDAMPHNDQHHSFNVLRALGAADHTEPALMQAALLHDVAKSSGGVTIFHRVAVVLMKIVWPDWRGRMAQPPTPARSDLRYPFWVHVNHPQMGAEMAAAAGCDPLAVTLIRRHQDCSGGAEEQRRRGDLDLLLTALRTADDDN